jgi:hypothetical protein
MCGANPRSRIGNGEARDQSGAIKLLSAQIITLMPITKTQHGSAVLHTLCHLL